MKRALRYEANPFFDYLLFLKEFENNPQGIKQNKTLSLQKNKVMHFNLLISCKKKRLHLQPYKHPMKHCKKYKFY